MADQTDIEKLAKDYMDLWQEHLTAASQDQNTAEIMAKTMAMMNSGAATFANAISNAAKSSGTSGEMQQDPQNDHGVTNSTRAEKASSAGASPASLSPEHSDPVVDQLLERIALLEERITQLEQTRPAEHVSKVRKRK